MAVQTNEERNLLQIVELPEEPTGFVNVSTANEWTAWIGASLPEGLDPDIRTRLIFVELPVMKRLAEWPVEGVPSDRLAAICHLGRPVQVVRMDVR